MPKTWTIDEDGWVRGALFGITVEIRPIPRSAGQDFRPVDADADSGVLHTGEGDLEPGDPGDPGDPDQLWGTLNLKHVGPWICGEGRIIQTRPIGVQSAALRENPPHNPNAQVRMDIETTADSSTSPWLWKPNDLEAVVALMAFAAIEGLVPAIIPNGWPDLPDPACPLPWAANNARRQQAAAGKWPAPGWWMHLEVPWSDPTWHWDCGALQRVALIQLVQAKVQEFNASDEEPPPDEEDDMALTEKQAEALDWLAENKVRLGKLLDGFRDGSPGDDDADPATGPYVEAGKGLAKLAADRLKAGDQVTPQRPE